MKNLLTYVATGILFAGLSACSTNKSKDVAETFPEEVEVVDAGAHGADSAKVSENHVIDAGKYKEDQDYSNLGTLGGEKGKYLPTERFYSEDREKYAPIGKLFYVLTNDSPAHCIKGKYMMVNNKKTLVVWSKSTVPSNYCIYQKTVNSEAEGFSIFIKDGGVCQPSYAQVTNDGPKRKIASVEPVNNTVSMSYCVEGTQSWGEAKH